MKDKSLYLPGLNGLRAIAALSIVISHTDFLPGITDFGLNRIFCFAIPMGAFAVTMFFVISGFLITYLLINEVAKQQDVSIKKFYMRRILRIWPLYYLFLIVSFGVYFLFGRGQEMMVNSMWFYVFFSANIPFIIKSGQIFILVHYWSLGVEEQFYLFWPWIVHFVRKKLLTTAVLIFVFLFLIKLTLWFIYGPDFYGYRILNVTRFDCMMVGAIGAILYFNNNVRFLIFFSSKIMQSFSWILFILVSTEVIHLPYPIAQEVISVAVLSIIIGQVTVKKRIINLENKMCDFLGKISYGIYVIHPLILLLLSKLYYPLNIQICIKSVLVFGTSLSVNIITAWLSYTYYEKPFLKLKSKFTVVRSSNSMSTS